MFTKVLDLSEVMCTEAQHTRGADQRAHIFKLGTKRL
jgi:hypothetical protein